MRTLRSAYLAAVAALALAAAPARAQSSQPPAGPLAALDDVLPDLIERAAASVVLVEVERPNVRRPLSPLERMGLGVSRELPGYFDRPSGPVTGVVVAPGLVATSSWNLEGNGAVTVVTPTGDRVPATRLGRDENLDVALLKVDAVGLVPLPRAEGPARVGQFVVLVARTPANGPLATTGIVSGLGRHRGDAFAHSARTSYQTAGGALIDLDGRLMGLSVRHSDRARQGQSSGVAFGAAAADLQKGLETLAKGEVIPRRKTPFLGIQGDPEAVEQGGVRVRQVLPGTAAIEAGLRNGDIIVIFNSVELRDFMHLREEIEKLAVGHEIVITIRRDGKEQDLRVKLGARATEED